jgi:cytochrome c-type biogenesis protein CcmH/NrfG
MSSKPPRPKGRSGKRQSFSPTMIVATIIAALVACSLIASSIGSIVLDRQASVPEQETETVPDRGYESLLRTTVAGTPDDARAAISLANLLSARGETREALDLYAQGVQLEPENDDYRIDFALALAESGALPDAELQYQRVLERSPDNAEALYFLGELYARWSPVRREEATDAFQRAIAAQPESVAADMAASGLARLNQQQGAATPNATEGS